MSKLKTLLDAIWNDNQVRGPCHRLWWHSEEFGVASAPGIWWSRGGKWAKTWPNRPPRDRETGADDE